MEKERGSQRAHEQHDPRRRENHRDSRLAAPTDDVTGHSLGTDGTAKGSRWIRAIARNRF
jgi:hypothetical protein